MNPKEFEDPQVPINRKERRKERRFASKHVPATATQLDATHDKYHIQQDAFHSLRQHPYVLGSDVREKGILSRFTEMVERAMGRDKVNLYSPNIYRADPAVANFAVAARNFHLAIEAYTRDKIPTFISEKGRKEIERGMLDARAEDFFGYSDHGRVSFAGIENMGLPLQPDDIRAINGLVRRNNVFGETYYLADARDVALQLPTQVLVRSKEVTNLDAVGPLAQRLIGYMDYYTALVLDRNSDILDFARTARYLGRPFMQALGAYLPAGTGLTPSSLIKLLEEREHANGDAAIWGWLNRYFRPEINEAYTVSGLPKHLFSYQLYDQDQDARATLRLGEHYRDSVKTSDIRSQLVRLYSYRRKLYPEMLSGVNIDFDKHHVISRIVLACQNKQNMMFVLLLNDGQTHLTLETNDKGEVFGIPYQLKNMNPNIEGAIATDVLTPVLDRARKMFPEIETAKIMSPIPMRSTGFEESVRQGPGGNEAKGTKRRHRSVPHFVVREPALPKPVVDTDVEPRTYNLMFVEKGEFKAIESEADLEGYATRMAKGLYRREARLQEDIVVLLKALMEDPKGEGVHKIVSLAERGENMWSFRGDLRGVRFSFPESRRVRVAFYFDPMNSNSIIIEDILHHDTFDRKYKN